MSVRTERVASLVKELLSESIQRRFRMEEVGLITVTEVRMSPDLKIAKAYISIFGNPEKKKQAFALLEAERAGMRSDLGRNLSLKFTPSLSLYLDETLDQAMHIEDLLNKIRKDAPKEDE
jgi:ribosome-binding factor A